MLLLLRASALAGFLKKRHALFCIATSILALLLVLLSSQSGFYHRWNASPQSLPTVISFTGRDADKDSAYPPIVEIIDKPITVQLTDRMTVVHRFGNGRISLSNSHYHELTNREAARMTPASQEVLYENIILEATADCSTTRRMGLREDGGWDICLVGPFTPLEPCFSFSFGVNNVWQFDDEVAKSFGCQVVTFDPSMESASHMHSEKVAFVNQGLHYTKGKLQGIWPMDTYLGHLKRFGAENFTIDILKIDIEGFEWGALEAAVRDGSLKNVKQLMLETHTESAPKYTRYISLLTALYDLGFRQWHHNWNVYGNYASKLNQNNVHSCCHELYYININFIDGSRPARNPSGSQLRIDDFNGGASVLAGRASAVLLLMANCIWRVFTNCSL